MSYLKNKYKGLALTVLILFIMPFSAKSQSASEMRNIFNQAESYYLYEDYELANQLYLLLETPENMNIKYKIGVCYLNIPGEKEKSIPYLEEAVKTATYDSRSTSFRENRAPLEAYFFLAKAYMINDDLEKGMSTLTAFKDLAGQTKSRGGMMNQEFIELQIQACKNAVELKKTPVTFAKSQLGPQFSAGGLNENPAVSLDGSSIVYTERRGSVNAIFYSKKERGKWQTPREITAELNAGEDCSSSSLNNDGTELFLYKTDNFDGAIYSSTLKDGVWSPITRLNRNINTRFYESHAAISADGKKLYFTSNRDGGYGNLDIYVSEKDGSGEWGPAVNLGPTINTPYNEDTPFITRDGSLLYFASEGHSSMGGYDIFKSRLLASAWQTPENLGYPINTTDDDKFYQPADNESTAYYSMTTDYKKRDIMFLELGKVEASRTFEINGIYSLSDATVPLDKNYYINLINSETGDTIDVGFPNKYSGQYSFIIPSGQYTIVYGSSFYYSQTIDTVIMPNHPTSVITIDVSLDPDPSRPKPVSESSSYASAAGTQDEYKRINLQAIPQVSSVEDVLMIVNVKVSDVIDGSVVDEDVLYYTVQVIALYNPVDESYFKFIEDLRILYNSDDKFYRYTTGRFENREDAYAWRFELMRKGYPDEIFVKKVTAAQ